MCCFYFLIFCIEKDIVFLLINYLYCYLWVLCVMIIFLIYVLFVRKLWGVKYIFIIINLKDIDINSKDI